MAPRPKKVPIRLVVATDGSPSGMAALRFAARLAGGGPTALTVLALGAEAESQAARELERRGVPARVRDFAPRPQEPIPEAIARESERLKADLVIVGSEPRDGHREWVLGGLALRLIYVAERPVAVIRAPRRHRKAA